MRRGYVALFGFFVGLVNFDSAGAISVSVGNQAVALRGVDVPDPGQICQLDGSDYDCGARAAQALMDKINDDDVTCEQVGRDGAGVLSGVCYVRGEELNSWLVANGWAVSDRSTGAAYVTQETQARRFELGLWRGEFVRPADWRRRLAQQNNRDRNDAMANVIKIAISGPDGAQFSGQCTLDTDVGPEEIAYEGTVPDTREFDGIGVACRFSTPDTITIEVRNKGNLSRTSTSGGTVNFNVR